MRDVVVVGAGVSGLTAAWRLEAAGREVLVVEARARIGGRTWSPQLGGAKRDVGATWVWDHETSVHELLTELDISTYPSRDAGVDLYDDGRALRRVRHARSAVPEHRLRGGTDTIAVALEERLESVTLNCAARALEPVDGGVRVVFDHGAELARHVVLALPPALLGSAITLGGVDSELIGLLRRTPTWMDDIAKVVAVYSRGFWREDGLSGRAFSLSGPMSEIHDLSGPTDEDGAALFGFVQREHARSEDWEARARAQFAHLFGAAASDPIAFMAHAWWSEMETSPVKRWLPHPGLFGAAVLRDPLMGGRVHLASTETSAVNTGHIDGAVRRGEDVARAILQAST